jgi:3-deoxy-7-phosphoheptulonate synthase
MIIILKPKVTEEQINHVVDKVKELGLEVNLLKGKERIVIGVIGEEEKIRIQPLESYPGVEQVMEVLKPYKLVSREFQPEDSIIQIKSKYASPVKIGGKNFVIMSGPCAIENKEILLETAKKVKKSGAKVIRGGAFKPRTSPYAFQGLGEEGLKYLAEVGRELKTPVVTEVMDTRQVELVSQYTDIIQIGARNMQNYNLLKEVGATNKTILLKRGFMSTVKEFLMSAEYIAANGNMNIILCERGIRTFEDSVRNSLDISSIPVLKSLSHLPVIVDPSHCAGAWKYVEALSMAAVAAGADGLIVETHACPEEALCDGSQSLLPKKFNKLVSSIKPLIKILGKKL